jgi:hypothetical protein
MSNGEFGGLPFELRHSFVTGKGRRGDGAWYQLALEHDTNNTAAHINLGKLMNQRGDRPAAMAHYEAALRINHPKAKEFLGRIERQ